MMLQKTNKKALKKSYKAIFVGFAVGAFQLYSASFFIPQAHAEAFALSTHPTTIQMKAQIPADLRSGFSISNQSEQSVKLNILLRPFKPDPANDGKVQYVEGNNPKLLQRVQIIDNGYAVSTVELGPKQTKNLQVRVQLQKGDPITDYYFSVIFLTSEELPKQDASKDASVLSTIQEGIALHVLVASGPKELPNAAIAEYSTPSRYRDSGPVPFTVKIRNNGPHFVTPKGVILITNIFGQTVGRIDLQNTNILAGTTRSMIGTPYQSAAKTPSPASSVWPEKFLLGIYTAHLSIALSADGPVYNQTIRFIAFPSKLLLILGLGMLLILLISLRIRKKLKDL
jgi:hypothetical protein